MELIFNRTQADVDRLNRLRERGWENLTSSQKAEWYDVATRGAYNYTDLNRVESAVAEIAKGLGLTLATKTDWNMWDVPTESDMARYLGNVERVRNACPNCALFPPIPHSMEKLTLEVANRIERILILAYRTAEAFIRCGDVYSGDVERW